MGRGTSSPSRRRHVVARSVLLRHIFHRALLTHGTQTICQQANPALPFERTRQPMHADSHSDPTTPAIL